MAISTNNVITWSDFTTTCLNSIKSVCCNIDAFASNVPARMRSGSATTVVKSVTTTKNNSNAGWNGAPYTYSWSIQPSNLISVVPSSTVNSEWNTFMSNAGINTRSSQVVSAYDFTCAVALYMQFMAYHIKPVYSRRQGYNTVESQAIFQGCKYVTGTLNPDYKLSAPTLTEKTNSDIQTVVNRNFNANEILKRYSNPSISRYALV